MSLFWSVIPTDVVFNGEGPQPTREQAVNGVTMMVSDTGSGFGRIERVLSTNPMDYLRPEWQPGQLVPLRRS